MLLYPAQSSWRVHVRLNSIALRIVIAVIVLPALLATAGCGGGSTATNQKITATVNPVTATLSATPSSIQSGQSATLIWSTSNADSVTIEGLGTVAANLSRPDTPSQATHYPLPASRKNGSKTDSATICVTPL